MGQHYGICEWSLPVSGAFAMRIAAEAGYEGIQLGEAGGRRMGYPLNEPRIQQLYRDSAEVCGITLHSLNLGALLAEGTLNYAADTLQGQWARESLLYGMDACRALGIHTVVITVDAPTAEAEDNMLHHMEYACRLAEERAVEIAMESALPLSDIQRILERVGPDVKICMDLLNPLRFGTGDPREQIRAFGNRISHFHMKDSQHALFQRGERGCTLLGDGDAGFHRSVETICALGLQETWMISENYYYLPPLREQVDSCISGAAQDLMRLRAVFQK